MNFYKICFLSRHRAWAQGRSGPVPRAPPLPRRGKWTRDQKLLAGARTSIVIIGCHPDTSFLLFTLETRPSEQHNFYFSSGPCFVGLRIMWKEEGDVCLEKWNKRRRGLSSHNPNDIRPDLIQLEMGRGQRADRRPGAGARCQLGKKRWVIAAQILFMILTALRPAPRIRHGRSIMWNYPHYATLGDVKTNTPHPWWHDLSVKKHRGSNNKQKPMRWKNQIEFRLVSSQWPTVPGARAQ